MAAVMLVVFVVVCYQWNVSGADDKYLICSLAAVLVLTANFLVLVAALLRCMPAVLDGTTVEVWHWEQTTAGWVVVLGLGWLQMAHTDALRSFVCLFWDNNRYGKKCSVS